MFENDKKKASKWEVLAMVKNHPVLTTLVLILVVVGLFFLLRPSQANSASKPNKTVDQAKKEQERKLPVEVALARSGSISSSIVTTASLNPDRQVTMISETIGIVEKIMVDEGNVVKEGQVLALLSNDEKKVALEKGIVHVKNAQQELDRKQASFNQKLISQAEYEKAKYEMSDAESEKDAAQVNLDRTTIRAPFSGIITERFIEKGQNINDKSQLFTLVDAEPLEAKIYLPEKEIFGIRENEPVELSLNSQKNVIFDGRIKQINPAVDPRTGTVKVTIEIVKAPAEVRPGSFVDVKLVTQRHDNTLLIPKKALIEEAGEKFVFLINKSTAVRRIVKVGFLDDQFAEILSGVNPGESVVTAGQGALRDGSKTEVVARR